MRKNDKETTDKMLLLAKNEKLEVPTADGDKTRAKVCYYNRRLKKQFVTKRKDSTTIYVIRVK